MKKEFKNGICLTLVVLLFSTNVNATALELENQKESSELKISESTSEKPSDSTQSQESIIEEDNANNTNSSDPQTSQSEETLDEQNQITEDNIEKQIITTDENNPSDESVPNTQDKIGLKSSKAMGVTDGENGVISHEFKITSPDGSVTYNPGDKIPNDGKQLLQIKMQIDMNQMSNDSGIPIKIPVDFSGRNSTNDFEIYNKNNLLTSNASDINFNGETILYVGTYYDSGIPYVGIRKYNGTNYSSDYKGIVNISFSVKISRVSDKSAGTSSTYYNNFSEDAEKIYYNWVGGKKAKESFFSMSVNGTVYPDYTNNTQNEELDTISTSVYKVTTEYSNFKSNSYIYSSGLLNKTRLMTPYPDKLNGTEKTIRILDKSKLDSDGNYKGSSVISSSGPIQEQSTYQKPEEIITGYPNADQIDAVYLTTIKAKSGSQIMSISCDKDKELKPISSTLDLNDIYKQTLAGGVGTKFFYKLSDDTYVYAVNYGTVTSDENNSSYFWSNKLRDYLTITYSDIAKIDSAIVTHYSNYTGKWDVNYPKPTTDKFKIIDGITQLSQDTISDEISDYNIEGQTSIKIHYVDLNGNLIDLIDTKNGFPTNKVSTVDNLKHTEKAEITPKEIIGYTLINNPTELNELNLKQYNDVVLKIKQKNSEATILSKNEKIDYPGEANVLYDSDGNIISKTNGDGNGVTDVYYIYIDSLNPEPIKTAHTINKTIHYQTKDGLKLADDFKVSVTITEIRTQDPNTGKITITYDQETGVLPSQINPAIPGYHVVLSPIEAESNQTVKFGDPDVEVTVIYEKNLIDKDCLVTFDSNLGSDVPSQKIKENMNALKPADPQKTGYIFKGWYTDNVAFMNQFDFNTPIVNDIILYAKWEKIKEPTETKYSIIFDSQGGSAVDTQSITENQKAIKPTDPSKEGFLFKGWYVEKEYTTPYDFNLPVNQSYTLYAKWEKISNQQISNNSVSEKPINEQSVKLPKTNEQKTITFSIIGIIIIALISGLIFLKRKTTQKP